MFLSFDCVNDDAVSSKLYKSFKLAFNLYLNSLGIELSVFGYVPFNNDVWNIILSNLNKALFGNTWKNRFSRKNRKRN